MERSREIKNIISGVKGFKECNLTVEEIDNDRITKII